MQCVSLSTASGMDMLVYPCTPSSMDVQGVSTANYGHVGCNPFHYQQCERVGCILDHRCAGCMYFFHLCKWFFTNAQKCRAVRHLVSLITEWTKCQCRKQSGTGITGPVPECFNTGLRYQMPECRFRRHRLPSYDGLQRFQTDSFCLPSKLRTRHKRFMIVVFL